MKALIFVLLLVFVAGCTQSIDVPTESKPDVQPTGEVKRFVMTAKQWEFVPDTIRVSLGDEVEITIKSIDVSHGLFLPEFGVNEFLQPGKEVTVKFLANKRGTFDFWCNVPCGSGHGGMRGQLIVQ